MHDFGLYPRHSGPVLVIYIVMKGTQPSFCDLLWTQVARLHAQRVFHRFITATRRAVKVQEKTLLNKIGRNADSEFGRRFQFDHIHSVNDFIRRVPVLRYEDHQPYIEQVKAGNYQALFGRREKVLMFALTSGTSDQPKYIPVTRHFLNEYRHGWNAFGIKALLDHPRAFLRSILQVTSKMDESTTSAGIPCGAITGLMAANQKKLVRKYYAAPRCVAEINDPTAKYYTIMRLAMPRDVAFMITASPATQLKLARTGNQHREQLIRDIYEGGLWEELPVSTEIREQLRPLLKPDSETAKKLEWILAERGRLLPRDYWRLDFLANWTGGSMNLYLQDFPEYFGDTPVRDIGLLASEGRITIPIKDHTPSGILDVTSHFFEFIPAECIHETNPPTLRCHELEVGVEYFLLLTTSSGLYRYDLHDQVRVVDYYGQAPVIEFLNKGTHISSLTGEKLTERQVVQAMERVAGKCKAKVTNFVLAPQWNDPPFYLLHVEGDVADHPFLDETLAEAMDEQLQDINPEYFSKRASLRLGPVRLNVLPGQFLAKLDHQRAERYRRGNEQYKHQYLYCRVGEDQNFARSDFSVSEHS